MAVRVSELPSALAPLLLFVSGAVDHDDVSPIASADYDHPDHGSSRNHQYGCAEQRAVTSAPQGI
jgi:hypothetical protein